MPNSLPSTIAVSNSATAVQINGTFTRLFMQSLTAGQVIYVRTDGTSAVVEADGNWAIPPTPDFAIVPLVAGTPTTNFSAIASAAAKLSVREVVESNDR